MTDLNEASLLKALASIRGMCWSDEERTKNTKKLIVTMEGVAMVRHRYATDPEFRSSVRERARADPEYRKLCEDSGLILRLNRKKASKRIRPAKRGEA